MWKQQRYWSTLESGKALEIDEGEHRVSAKIKGPTRRVKTTTRVPIDAVFATEAYGTAER